ncbi:hypothetical protein AB0L59_19215 [Streptomyces sp. NPDC052109]|uniref:hypothetical protein n=1 Tax=Streptomyces sp. NPDC052109 TaxID=3155527 RepID=UPI00342C9878
MPRPRDGPFASQPADDRYLTLGDGLDIPYFCTRAAWPHLIAAAAVAALTGMFGFIGTAYCVSVRLDAMPLSALRAGMPFVIRRLVPLLLALEAFIGPVLLLVRGNPARRCPACPREPPGRSQGRGPSPRGRPIPVVPSRQGTAADVPRP